MMNISTFFYQFDNRTEESGNLFIFSDLINDDFIEFQDVWDALDQLEFEPADSVVEQILEKSRNL